LIDPQPGEAGRGAQLQRSRLLAPSGIDRLLEPRCCFGSVARLEGTDWRFLNELKRELKA
jgi:hypothetical protein